jgi:hypothetical protein
MVNRVPFGRRQIMITTFTTFPTVVRSEAGVGGRRNPALAAVLALLALALAVSSLLGPLVLGVLVYRTSPTTLNQLLGSDAAILFVIAPATLVAALLAARGHPAAPLLATGIGVFTIYTYAQVIIGQEYLRLPGNVERFYPLLLTVFVLAEAAVVLGLAGVPADLPPLAPRVRRAAALALFAVALFLVVGLHLSSTLLARQDPARLTEYASSPTPFWLVKLMDLGIVVPAAVVTGVGLWRGARWALKAGYVLLTGYTGLAVSVTSMAIVMIANRDPGASVGLAAGFALFTVVFVTLTGLLYRQTGPKARRQASGDPARGSFRNAVLRTAAG